MPPVFDLNKEFGNWEDLSSAAEAGPKGFGGVPKVPGVYCLRVKAATQMTGSEIAALYRSGAIYKALDQMDKAAAAFFSSVGFGSTWGWGYIEYAESRLSRLGDLKFSAPGVLIDPTLYIGQSNNLHRRAHELMYNEHTVNHALWAVLNAGWKVELGFRACNSQKEEEDRLIDLYSADYGGKPPLQS